MARSYAARDSSLWPSRRAVELGDRDRPVEPHDRRGVEADQLVVERDDLRQSVSRKSRASVWTALIAARIW